MIALAEQARLAMIKSATNHRDLRRQTTRALRRDHNAYWKAIADETERAAACGDTRKLNQMLKSVSRRPAEVGEVLFERDGSVIPEQARRQCRWEKHFKELLNHAASLTSPFHHRKTKFLKLTQKVCHPWNYGNASALQVYCHCSCKGSSAGMVKL